MAWGVPRRYDAGLHYSSRFGTLCWTISRWVHETLGIRSPMTATHWAEFLPPGPSISYEFLGPESRTCITVKMNAVLIPNSSMPSAASRAPSICQRGCSVTPDAPRVAIEID